MSFGRMNTLISIAQEVVTKDTEGFATKTDNILVSIHAVQLLRLLVWKRSCR